MSGFLIGVCIIGAAIAGLFGVSWFTVPVLGLVIIALSGRELFPLRPIHGIAGPVGGLILAYLLACVLVALAFGLGRLLGLAF
jgi:hypothetical protein